MDCLVVVGLSSLGIFIGLLVGWCVNGEKEPSAKGYGAIIAAGAGAIASFVPFFTPQTTREMWLYPISLLVGLLVAPVFDVAITWFYTWKRVSSVFHEYDRQYPRKRRTR